MKALILKTNRIFPIIVCVLLLFTSCQDDFTEDPETLQVDNNFIRFDYPALKASEQPSSEPLSEAELRTFLKENEDVEPWDIADDYTLWSGIKNLQSRVTIGIKPLNQELANDSPRLFEDNQMMRYARDYTFNYISMHLKEETSVKNLEYEAPNDFPVITVTLDDYELISKIRQLPTVRYVEPTYDFVDEEYLTRNSSGCGDNEFLRDILEHDEVAFDGGAYLVSWNQIAHNVPEAWEISRGRGVTVGVIDTGVSNNQTLLGDLFNRYHVGKRITKGFTHSEHNSPNDTCGHGTTICGQIAGPLNRERAIVGIAYEANLYSIKVGNGVLLSEQKRINAVVEAMRIFSNNPQVKIINISMGSLTSKGKIKDAVNQAYARQKLIVAAAGYKIGSVVRGTYPARYDNVLAATGSLFDAANPNNLESFSDGNPTGRFVDFAAYLRRRVDDDSALGMNRAGFQVRRARGSSSAAANVAGIAALVWSARPQLNRDQVRRILIDAASNRNGISNQFGWGIIDARRAVELAVDFNIPMSVQLNGPREITSSGTQRWTTSVRNAEGSISYRWFWNGQQVSTSSSYSRYVAVSGGITQNRLRLEVTTSTGQNVSFTEIIYSNGSGINI